MTKYKALPSHLLGIILGFGITTFGYVSLTPNNLLSGYSISFADLLLPLFFFVPLRKPSYLSKSTILFAALPLISTLYSISPGLTLFTASKFSVFILLFGSVDFSRISLLKVFRYIEITLIFSLILCVPLIFLGSRWMGLQVNPNIFGGLFTVFAVLLSNHPEYKPYLHGLWTWIGIAGSVSRSALIGLLPLLHKRWWLIIPLTFLAAFFTLRGASSMLSRIEIWKDVFHFIQNRPLGYGWGIGFLNSQSDPGYISSIPQNPHNIYLIALQSLGIPLGLLFIGTFLFRAIRSPILISIALISLLDHYWVTVEMGFILLAFLLALPAERKAKCLHINT